MPYGRRSSAVGDITDPPVVHLGGFELTERLRRGPVESDVESERGEVALHGPSRRASPVAVSSSDVGADEPHDVGRDPSRVLPREPGREIEQLHIAGQRPFRVSLPALWRRLLRTR